MGEPIVIEYDVPFERAFPVLVAGIARCGYAIKHSDKESCIVAFESGMSMNSWTGQTLSAHVLAISDHAVQITIGGARKNAPVVQT